MATSAEQQETIALGPGLLKAEFFRAGGWLIARVLGQSGAAHYLFPSRLAVHSIEESPRVSEHEPIVNK